MNMTEEQMYGYLNDTYGEGEWYWEDIEYDFDMLIDNMIEDGFDPDEDMLRKIINDQRHIAETELSHDIGMDMTEEQMTEEQMYGYLNDFYGEGEWTWEDINWDFDMLIDNMTEDGFNPDEDTLQEIMNEQRHIAEHE